MLGAIFVSIGSLFEEIATLIGKKEIKKGEESLYLMGFLSHCWVLVLFIIIAFVRSDFVFSMASLSTFSLRAFLEIFQSHVTLLAVIYADRSTVGFLRVLTLPLLLVVDVILGYVISSKQMAGVGLIIVTLFVLFATQKINRRGIYLVLFTALNAVATISLYKYNITHYNSVTAEMIIMGTILCLYFLTAGYVANKEDIFKEVFAKPIFVLQSLLQGTGTAFDAFAYSFAPASVISTAKRSASTILTMISGKLVFSERHMIVKSAAVVFLIIGIILLLT